MASTVCAVLRSPRLEQKMMTIKNLTTVEEAERELSRIEMILGWADDIQKRALRDWEETVERHREILEQRNQILAKLNELRSTRSNP
jgi:chromosome segregation ATPase